MGLKNLFRRKQKRDKSMPPQQDIDHGEIKDEIEEIPDHEETKPDDPVTAVMKKTERERIYAVRAISDLQVLVQLSQEELDPKTRQYVLAQAAVFGEYGHGPGKQLYLTAHAELQDQDAIVYALTHKEYSGYEGRELLLNKLEDIGALKTLVKKWTWIEQGQAVDRLVALMEPADVIKFAGEAKNVEDAPKYLFSASARCGMADAVKHFIDEGMEVNEDVVDAAMNYGKGNGRPEVLRLLLHSGFPVNGKIQNETNTLLTRAIGDREMVKVLLEEGADPNEETNDLPLLEAVRNRDDDTASMLLEYGADKSINNNAHALGLAGWGTSSTGTSLHAAVLLGRADLVKLLLEHGADPKVAGSMRVDVKGHRPKDLTDDPGILELLAKYERA